MPSRHAAKVALCTPVHTAVDPLALESHHWLVKQSVSADGMPLVASFHQVLGRPVAEARNALTVQALQTDATHLLWIDADMTFDADVLEKLLDRDLPIVGGLCFGRQPPYPPVGARLFDPSWALDPRTLGWIYDHPREGLIEVDVTGGAFLLVRREVYRAIHEREAKGDARWAKWWTPSEYEGSEDFSFCHRAQQAGYKIQIDCSVRIGHIGRVVIDEAFSRRNRTFDDVHLQPMLVPFKRDELDANERPTAPVVTVVIPVLNQEHEFLRAAVLSALAQTWPVEVIVVDDGCDDAHDVLAILRGRPGTDELDLLANPHVWIEQHPDGKNHGIAASLNLGIATARTDWICWLSSDDLFVPHKVEAQWLAMNSAKALAGFHGYNVFMDNGKAVQQPLHTAPHDMQAQRGWLARACYVNGSTTMIHRSVFEDVGLYDTSFHLSQDWELWNRIGLKYEWHYVAEALGMRREVAGNTTQTTLREGGARADLWRAEEARIRQMYAPPDFRLLLETVANSLPESAREALPKWLRDRVRAALNPVGK